ncbi:MAG: DNA-directed RNA polymerase subunit beta [bacterium]
MNSLRTLQKKEEYNFAKLTTVLALPDLVEIQKQSFEWLRNEGLLKLFRDISPVESLASTTEEGFVLEFLDLSFEDPKYSPEQCRRMERTYESAMKVRARLINRKTGEIKEQEVYLCDFPLMTRHGTFVFNGAERVVLSQLIRSPGVYFSSPRGLVGINFFTGKIIPNRGAWVEFEFDVRGQAYIRIDKTRKIPITTFLRAIGFGFDKNERRIFLEEHFTVSDPTREKLLGFTLAEDLQPAAAPPLKKGTKITAENVESFLKPGVRSVRLTEDCRPFFMEDSILNTLNRETLLTRDQALLDIYKKLRPGDIPTVDHAERLLDGRFFQPVKYDLSDVGRYKINEKLCLDIHPERLALTRRDFLESVRYMLALRLKAKSDIAKERYFEEVLTDGEQKFYDEFQNAFGGEPIQDDIDHLGNRRVRCMGELLLNRLRGALGMMEKTIKDRMIQYDSVIATPQSLINPRPLIAAINEFFGSSPLSQFMDQTNPLAALTHKRKLSAMGPGGLTRERAGFEVRDVHHSHYGRICPIESPEGPNIGLIGSLATYAKVDRFGFLLTPYRVVKNGRVTDDVVYLNAAQEDRYHIAQANAPIDKTGRFIRDLVAIRHRDKIDRVNPKMVHYMDVSPKQLVSVTTALIPFLEHDDANRALMGSNMQRQAVPLVLSEAPLVGTGLEHKVALDAGSIITAANPGVVTFVDAETIRIKPDGKRQEDVCELIKFERSNQSTCINFTPLVRLGARVETGEPIADGPNTRNGCLALGRNLLVAFMPWEGYNYEDAVIISERLLKRDFFTSIFVEKYDCEARETKLGPEEITRDIPNVNEEVLANLDENAIVKIGTHVKAGDILIGKVIPKGETEPTAEERLLRAIFGEKARDVRNTSLKVPHGGKGVVTTILDFSRESGADFAAGKTRSVRVFVAQRRKVMVGDKLAGRHGNKGVISKIVPEEDMPFLADGAPVDIILNPLGVPSRMNIGQILEAHLGWAAHKLNMVFYSPTFEGADENEIREWMRKARLPEDGKVTLYNGKTGEPFDEKVMVGYIYMLKLNHMVEDKMHARSTGSYALVTQQPLGGKAQFGGQRFGEMEVWALEAYGAAVTLQELLTIKSDDITGRVKTYEAIVKGENISKPGIPESFNVLVKELQALALNITLLSGAGRRITQTAGDESVGSILLDELGIQAPSYTV